VEKTLTLPGIVYALGAEASSAAASYGAATGRPVKLCSNPDEIVIGCYDVVMCTTGYITGELMHHLFVNTADGSVPGRIFGRTSGELEQICQRQASRLRHPRIGNSRRLFLSPTLPFSVIDQGTDVYVGGKQPNDALALMLSSGAAVLTVSAPSLGFELPLTFHQRACALLDNPVSDLRVVPSCQLTGRCTVFPSRPKIADAVKKGWLVPISKLQAEIVIFSSCALTRVQDEFFDPACSLGAASLRQGDFGVVISTWRAESGTPHGVHLNGLINDLCTGMKAGRAVYSFNHSGQDSNLGMNLCLLGDPCFYIESGPVLPRLPVYVPKNREVTPLSQISDCPVAARANLLRAAIANRLRDDTRYDPAKSARLDSGLLSFLNNRNSLSESDREQTLAELDAALLDFFCGFPVMGICFQNLIKIDLLSEHHMCPNCRAPARDCIVSFPGYSSELQKMVRCPRCSDCLNLPSSWQAALNLDRMGQRIIGLSGVPPAAQVRICLFLWEKSVLQNEYSWAESKEGCWTFELPEQHTSEPLYCQVVIACQLQIGTVGLKMPREPERISSQLKKI
jgi:hypothetical protein